MSTEPYISLDVLAASLDLPAKWLRQKAEAGEIPALFVHRRWRFSEAAVREALLRMQQEGARSKANEHDIN